MDVIELIRSKKSYLSVQESFNIKSVHDSSSITLTGKNSRAHSVLAVILEINAETLVCRRGQLLLNLIVDALHYTDKSWTHGNCHSKCCQDFSRWLPIGVCCEDLLLASIIVFCRLAPSIDACDAIAQPIINITPTVLTDSLHPRATLPGTPKNLYTSPHFHFENQLLLQLLEMLPYSSTTLPSCTGRSVETIEREIGGRMHERI